MLRSVFLIATLATAALAQSATSQAMPAAATQGFDAGLVNSTRKADWCRGQRNTCGEICGRTSQNACDEVALTYNCVCYNGTVPDCTAYQSTLPFYICEETYAQCITNHPNDLEGQSTCMGDHQCGNLTAQAATDATATSASPSGSATESATASASSSSASANAAALIMPIPTSAFVALLFGLCGLAL